MSQIPFADIAANLATRYDGLTPPAGEPAITASTSQPGESVPNAPFVMVLMAEDPAEFDYGGGLRTGRVPFEVIFAIEKAADLARQRARLAAWATVLLDATLTGVHLDLAAYVASCWARSMEVGDVEYGGQLWAGIRLIVTVQTSDGISPTA